MYFDTPINTFEDLSDKNFFDYCLKVLIEIKAAVASSSGVALTAGVVAWVLRGGALMTSLISTMPMWKGFDPLPILAYRDDEDEDENISEDKIPTSLEELRKIKELKEKGSLVTEGKHQRKDGSIFEVEVNVQYISHRERDYIVAIVRDISERKQMEEALVESKERYTTLFEESKDALYIVNAQGRFENVNQAMLDLFGFKPK